MRTHTLARLLVAGTALAVAAAGCAGSSTSHGASPTPTGPVRLTVLHTNDLWGETNPCG